MIKAIYDAGLSQVFYYGFWAIGLFVLILATIKNADNYQMPKFKSVIMLLCVWTSGTFLMFFLTWVENGFKSWGANNIVRVFAYLPIVAYFAAKIMKMEWGRLCDFLAPLPTLFMDSVIWDVFLQDAVMDIQAV